MKAIMISIRPRYVADILNGRKTIEIRKSIPKCDLPIEVYIYCTKDQNEELWWYDGTEDFRLYKKGIANEEDGGWHLQNGKVVAKFTLNKVEEIKINFDFETLSFSANEMNEEEILEKSCLSDDELGNYLLRLGNLKGGYAWHIDNLVIFDKPKEISEFMKVSCKGCPFENTQTCHNDTTGKYCRLTRAPQSWQYVEVDDETLNQK